MLDFLRRKLLPKKWANYEAVARHVLSELRSHFGIEDVEGKQVLRGYSGTDWEVDALAKRESDGSSLIIECRMYKRSLTQEAVAAVAYRIRDLGAGGGFTVSPKRLQKGAKKVADYEKIQHIILDRNSTTERWLAKINEQLRVGLTFAVETKPAASLGMVVKKADGKVENR